MGRPANGGVITIAGAGPAEPAAAITLARAGRSVVVHEAHPTVGFRLQRNVQSLENRGTERHVLSVLADLGITTDFDRLPCREGQVFDAWDRACAVRSREPLYSMVERGPDWGNLDSALPVQARMLGVEVRFNSALEQLA